MMKDSLYGMFQTDSDLENRGIELDYGNGCIVRVRRLGSGNEKFAQVYEKKMRPHRAKERRGQLPEDVMVKVMREVVAEAIVVGWEGVKKPDGKGGFKEIPFTVENAVQVFEDLPDFFLDIVEQARDIGNFLTDIQEDDVKNSPKS